MSTNLENAGKTIEQLYNQLAAYGEELAKELEDNTADKDKFDKISVKIQKNSEAIEKVSSLRTTVHRLLHNL